MIICTLCGEDHDPAGRCDMRLESDVGMQWPGAELRRVLLQPYWILLELNQIRRSSKELEFDLKNAHEQRDALIAENTRRTKEADNLREKCDRIAMDLRREKDERSVEVDRLHRKLAKDRGRLILWRRVTLIQLAFILIVNVLKMLR